MKSLWMEKKLPRFAPLDGDCSVDVLIIGGGLTGLNCAYELEQRGVDYLLVEADRIMAGVSGYTTAKITSQHGFIYDDLLRRFGLEAAKMYLEANQSALGRYEELAKGIDCDFESRDSYVYSLNKPGKLEKELLALERLGFPGEYAQDLPLPFRTAGAVRFPNQAQFHPRKFAAGIASGLNIREKTKVQSFDGTRYLTNWGAITPKKVIIATHFPLWNKHGGYFLKLYQHRSYVLGLEPGPELNGMYVDGGKTGFSFRNAGNLLLLGGGAHRTGKSGTAWAELEALAKRHYPNAQQKYRWATQDCMSLDAVPYIGRYSSNTPDVYVASGFQKWGMTSAMVAALVLADLIEEKENPWAPVFSPQRSALRPQLLANAWEATVNLLTPKSPRCPHMGCALHWNPQERTWDCACHGSRFEKDGTLINNPATDDLKRS